MKLKAGALVYVIFIALLLFSITALMLLLHDLYKQSDTKLNGKMYSLLALNSALELTLSDYFIWTSESETISLEDMNLPSPVNIQRESWGLYEIYKAKVQYGSSNLYKSILVGSQHIQKSNTALYLSDLKRPLHLSGSTVIEGEIYLPKSGFEVSRFEGNAFSGILPKKSQISRSSISLPSIKSARISTIDEMLQRFLSSNPTHKILLTEDTIQGHWIKNPVEIISADDLYLTNKTLHGKLIVVSLKSIHLSNCQVNGPIFIAPRIILENKIRGYAQFIATEELTLNEVSEIEVPSTFLLRSQNQYSQSALNILKSKVSADVYLTSSASYRQKNLLKIDEDSEVHGLIYCQDNAELNGKLIGSIFCNNLILETSNSTYQNYLNDVFISRIMLNKNYSTSLLLNEQHKTEILCLN